MNWLDIVLGIVILLSVVAGIKKGLARTAVGLGASILGLLCGLWFYRMVGAYLTFIDSRHIANLVAFSMIFVAFVLLGSVIGILLDRLLKLVHLSWLNRLLGGAFGFVRGVLVAAVVVLAIMTFTSQPGPKSVTHSRVAPYVIGTAKALTAAAPYEVKNAFRNSYERIKLIWADALKKGTRRLPETEI